mmetsp:Transcript_9166/g.15703  ORF Transcript_9166/g.15703 Transcript_9166/m.15703 type:complete len:237 (+) Transcript_9166:685-1395(+)
MQPYAVRVRLQLLLALRPRVLAREVQQSVLPLQLLESLRLSGAAVQAECVEGNRVGVPCWPARYIAGRAARRHARLPCASTPREEQLAPLRVCLLLPHKRQRVRALVISPFALLHLPVLYASPLLFVAIALHLLDTPVLLPLRFRPLYLLPTVSLGPIFRPSDWLFPPCGCAEALPYVRVLCLVHSHSIAHTDFLWLNWCGAGARSTWLAFPLYILSTQLRVHVTSSLSCFSFSVE